jgi:predicted metal-dependent hydrolase
MAFDIPPYTIRVSAKAQRVTLRISPRVGFEVVIPRGYNRREVPSIVAGKRQWIERTLRRLGPLRSEEEAVALPTVLDLRALNLSWTVSYGVAGAGRSGTGQSGTVHCLDCGGRGLEVCCDPADPESCRLALRNFLKERARRVLIPQLETLARHNNLPYSRIHIRGQKTRWGSYSARGTVSLNWKLLFLPPELVRYVLLHELCHGVHLNHSKRYWARLAELEPDFRDMNKRLRQGWGFVPAWADLD